MKPCAISNEQRIELINREADLFRLTHFHDGKRWNPKPLSSDDASCIAEINEARADAGGIPHPGLRLVLAQ